MKTIHIFLIFTVVAAIQLVVPSLMIFNKETVLKKGAAYRFKTQPIDPSDPFRGKYITLNYEVSTYNTKDSLWQQNEDIYVYVDTDSLDFAQVDTISKVLIPNKHQDYIKAKVAWYSKYNNNLQIDFPFDRYYMEETKAYAAEVAVRNRQRDTIPNDTYALVFVKNGEAVLNDVIIDDMSIKDYVEQESMK